jgi:hypothetical protein
MGNTISILCMVVGALGLSAAIALFARPDTFRVKTWIKIVSYLNFIIDMAGALLIFGHFQSGWSQAAHDLGTAMILTSSTGLLSVFLYVHVKVIPAQRKGFK